mmetsp:Transcript_3556/g.3954  ORF Transcript_3556/g.3954 Transcript_3556/m.3954 type:complete len:292 (-) Transcript_3556:106-981(-)|eukprot:CAMPEP_0195281430 /NCGR_PEP_ID=MMETSP0707-20130614/741_1 /TAXON_ID=33640 /ORGANISM="Asterionellopsis glacialis, Strain CCMP134" /LENGTH=291 /DNA_ID=CAMNT_0040340313 /DNA_START=111 /DNA_END=986 /DNA_ORIENTATION=+
MIRAIIFNALFLTVATTAAEPSISKLRGSERLLAEPVCGDGVCETVTEDCENCPEDCCIFKATYETGTIHSGITGLQGTYAAAADAAFVTSEFARQGTYSIGHKVVIGDPNYSSSGAARSESDTLAVLDTRYTNGTNAVYKFSFLLHDWVDWLDQGIPVDIIFQFKHTQGAPDGFFGIKRNSLIMRYNGAERFQLNVVPDMRPFDNQWIDIKAEIRWRDDDTGSLKVWAKTPDDSDYILKIDKPNFRTFTDAATGDFGYLKYGLYRPDSTLTNNAITREVYHDDIIVSELV